MPNKSLTDYLVAIGQEIDRSHADVDDTLIPITKDEALARELFNRALGYVVVTENGDGTSSHRVIPPDPKAQQFIFERREGKFVTPQSGRTASLLEKIADITKSQANTFARKAVDGPDAPQTDA